MYEILIMTNNETFLRFRKKYFQKYTGLQMKSFNEIGIICLFCEINPLFWMLKDVAPLLKNT